MSEHRRRPGLEGWARQASPTKLNATAGAAGGFVAGLVTCPLDTIKIRLQAQESYVPFILRRRHRPPACNQKFYRGTFGTARVILREEGIRGLYRGGGLIILGYLPTWALWFATYEKSKGLLQNTFNNMVLVNMCSSIIAGVASTAITNPIWVLKVRVMAQAYQAKRHCPKDLADITASSYHRPHWYYRSGLDAARKMYRYEGTPAFYAGLGPALVGISHLGVQFPAYEYLRRKFTGGSIGDPGANWFAVLYASIFSKVLASSVTYPHEVIRTRLQIQRRAMLGPEFLLGLASARRGSDVLLRPKYRGMVRTFQTVLREEGWRALYAGLGTNILRTVPSAGATMLTYEYAMQTLNGLRKAELDFEGAVL